MNQRVVAETRNPNKSLKSTLVLRTTETNVARVALTHPFPSPLSPPPNSLGSLKVTREHQEFPSLKQKRGIKGLRYEVKRPVWSTAVVASAVAVPESGTCDLPKMAASKRLSHILVASFCLVLLAAPAMTHTWGHHRPSYRKPYGWYANSQRGLYGSYGSYGNREGGYGSEGNHRRPTSVSPAPQSAAAPAGHGQGHEDSEGVIGTPPVPAGEGVVGIPPVPTSEGVFGAPPVATDGGKSHIHLVDAIEGIEGEDPPFLNTGFSVEGSDPSALAPGVSGVNISDIDLRRGPVEGE
ncbi:uncharacterized protein LOC122266701 [Penaeus japonicus]|uniref:uncharacterized protein LOC122266701 n=1 Tax=Penaeus japonicus TaxID=27405 RepID=UPI001C70D9DB|nr:uncharacterized protein LOC122266701 [Penaeus japonicus]